MFPVPVGSPVPSSQPVPCTCKEHYIDQVVCIYLGDCVCMCVNICNNKRKEAINLRAKRYMGEIEERNGGNDIIPKIIMYKNKCKY